MATFLVLRNTKGEVHSLCCLLGNLEANLCFGPHFAQPRWGPSLPPGQKEMAHVLDQGKRASAAYKVRESASEPQKSPAEPGMHYSVR